MTKYSALDYTSPIPGAVLKANGITDVFRYITNPAWPKSLSAPEVRDLKANGINIHLNYEETADFMLAGYTGGLRCAQYARMLATALGFSVDEPIIYSADFDVSTTQVPTILDFLMGAEFQDKSRSRVRCYGGYAAVNASANRGYAVWQSAGWNYGKKESRALAWQSTDQVTLSGVRADGNVLNPNYVRTPMSTIPSSIAARWPILATDFPPNGEYDDETAIIWADAGARYTADKADEILAAIKATPVVGENPTVGTLSLSDTDVARIAVAVVKELGKATAGG